MKKALCLLLVLFICVSAAVPVFSTETSVDRSSSITLYQQSNGVWKEGNNVTSRNITDSVTVTQTEEIETIYESKENDYFQKINETEYIQVEKISLPLTQYSSYTALKGYEVPQEILDDVSSMAAAAEKNKNTNAEINLYVTASSSTPNTLPRTKTTWNSKTFYHYELYFTDLWTGWQTVASGSGISSSVLSSICDMTLNAIGSTSSKIGTIASVFGNGLTALEFWDAATTENPIYGNTSNKVMVDVCPDLYLKYTFYDDPTMGEEILGCATQKAKIKEIESSVYLYTQSGGKKVTGSITPNAWYYTPNYKSPEQTAYQHTISGWTERVQGVVYNKKVIFEFPDFDWPSTWPSV